MSNVSVSYSCSCKIGPPLPLDPLYVCRDCDVLACPSCVSQEIETLGCPNCFETVLPSDAGILMNRCPKCLLCPVCFVPLSLASRGEKSCYLLCGFCRWNSIELGITAPAPDALLLSLVRGELTTPNQVEASWLRSQFSLARDQVIKAEKSRRKFTMFHQKDTKLTAIEAEFAAHAVSASPSVAPDAMAWGADPCAGAVSADSHPLTTAPIASLSQRLGDPARQPVYMRELAPHRVPLTSRRSKRHAQCDRYLVRPESVVGKAGMRVANVAYTAVIRVTVFAFPQLQDALWNTVLLVFTSPLSVPVKFSVRALSAVPHATLTAECDASLAGSLSAFDDLETSEMLPAELKSRAVVDTATDAAAAAATAAEDDDGVVWQAQNRAIVRVRVKPADGQVARFALGIVNDYTTEAGKQHRLDVPVIIELPRVNA